MVFFVLFWVICLKEGNLMDDDGMAGKSHLTPVILLLQGYERDFS